MIFSDLLRKRARNGSKAKENLPNDGETPTATDEGTQGLHKIDASAAEDDDVHGVEIKEFASRNHLSTEAVWQKIKDGLLVARTENGFVYVYGTSSEAPTIMPALPVASVSTPAHPDLPPLPMATDDLDYSHLPAVNPLQSAEIALLVDHLALAKEQNHELLRISQESITQIRTMSAQVIAAKDDVIAVKEKLLSQQTAELETIKAQLAAEKEEKRRMRQELEDLQMLAKTLGEMPE